MTRFLDILFSGLALLCLSPLLVPVMLVLRFSGEGEIFYVQQRVGKDGKMFGVMKFATMLKDSPSLGTGTITLKGDPRVLPVGRFLRKTKINELPQLFNVLSGSMSLIGPRPQTQRCFNAFPDHHKPFITQVAPGLSGIGSIVFRNEEDMMDDADNANDLYDDVIMPYKGDLERWYVDNISVYVYVMSIVLTVRVVLTGKGELIFRAYPTLPPVPKRLRPYILSEA